LGRHLEAQAAAMKALRWKGVLLAADGKPAEAAAVLAEVPALARRFSAAYLPVVQVNSGEALNEQRWPRMTSTSLVRRSAKLVPRRPAWSRATTSRSASWMLSMPKSPSLVMIHGRRGGSSHEASTM
jgi:hypothetical protein